MLMYYIFLSIPLIWYLITKKVKINNLLYLWICMFFLCVVSALRNSSIGADYNNYIALFYSIAKTGDAYLAEKGFVKTVYLVSKIFSNHCILALMVNMMLFIPLYILIKKYVSHKYWSLCMLIFVANPYLYVQLTFNLMRQCCATGILILALFSWIKTRSKIITFLLIISAALFHKASLIFGVLLVLITSITWSKKRWEILATLCVFLNIMGLKLVSQILTFMLVKLPLPLNIRYATYEASLLNNPVYLTLIMAFIYWLCGNYSTFSAHVNDLYPSRKIFINLYMFTMCILPLAIANDAIYRFRIYMLVVSLPGLAIIFETIEQNSIKRQRRSIITLDQAFLIAYVCYFISFYIAYFLYLSSIRSVAYVPFKFMEF